MLIESLFPRKCFGCSVSGQGWVCAKCKPLPPQKTKIGRDLSYLFPYEGILKRVLMELKFKGAKGPARHIFQPLLTQMDWSSWDTVILTPSHWSRRLFRGGDPLSILFPSIANQKKVLKRIKRTPALHSLSRDQRLKVMHGAFKVSRPEAVRHQRILCVDDILTTGATFESMRQTLLPFHPQSVEGLFVFYAGAKHDQ